MSQNECIVITAGIVVCLGLAAFIAAVVDDANANAKVKISKDRFEPYCEFKVTEDQVTSVALCGNETREEADDDFLPKHLPNDIRSLCITMNPEYTPCPVPEGVKLNRGCTGTCPYYYYWMNQTRGRIGFLDSNSWKKVVTYADFKDFSKIRELRLDNNRLTEINDYAFDDMTQLQILTLNSNDLTNLRKKTFRGLTSLKFLSIVGNRISSIDSEAFKDTKKIEVLLLSCNKLKRLDWDTFAALPVLKTLELANNQISSVAGIDDRAESQIQFTNGGLTKSDGSDNHLGSYLMREVITLDLEGNLLTSLDGSFFSRVPNLEKVKLANNSLSWIARDTFKLGNLYFLTLHGNKLTTVHLEWFSSVTAAAIHGNEVRVTLDGNNFDCACGMLKHQKFLNELRENGSVPTEYIKSLEITCSSPENVKGLTLKDAAEIIENDPECIKINPVSADEKVIYENPYFSIKVSNEMIGFAHNTTVNLNSLAQKIKEIAEILFPITLAFMVLAYSLVLYLYNKNGIDLPQPTEIQMNRNPGETGNCNEIIRLSCINNDHGDQINKNNQPPNNPPPPDVRGEPEGNERDQPEQGNGPIHELGNISLWLKMFALFTFFFILFLALCPALVRIGSEGLIDYFRFLWEFAWPKISE